MSGLLSISVQEARGLIAVNADVDKLAVVIGCSSLGSGGSPVLSPFYLSGQAAQTGVGYGDAPDDLCQIIEQRQSDGSTGTKIPAAICSTPTTTPATYGAIDVSGVVGTAVVGVHSATLPYGTYEAQLKCMKAGTIGTAGILLQYSLDGGRNFSNTVALGTATSYTIPNSNVRFDFGVKVAGTTDATAGALYGGGGTLNGLTLILNVNGAGATTLNLSGAGNTATENAFLAAITAQWPSVVATVNGSSHLVLTDANGASIVVGAGTANTALGLTANTYNGTLALGDIVKVRTFGPAPSAADIDAAFTLIANSTIDAGIIVCEWPCTAALAAHVSTGLDALKARGKRCAAIIRTRLPDFENAESEATWATLIEADFANFSDDRICKRAAYELVTDSMTTRQYLRSDLGQFAADVCRVGRFVWPCAPADRAIANVLLVDASGATVGHDEGSRGAVTGLSDESLGNTFSCVQRLDDPQRREAVYNTVPWVSYSAGGRIRNLMTRRLANAMERIAVSAGIATLGGRLFYTSTGPSTGTLTSESRNLVHSVLFNALSAEFDTEIGNAKDASVDTGLVQVSPSVTKSGGNLIGLSVTLAPQVAGFTLSLGLTLAIQE